MTKIIKKNVRKNILLFLLLLLICFTTWDYIQNKNNNAPIITNIAILQTNENPSSNAIRDKIVSEIGSCCVNVKLHIESAENDPNKALDLMQNFEQKSVEAIITIGTLASKIASLKMNDIPVIFTNVINPVHAGLVSEENIANDNIIGVYNSINLDLQLQSLKKMMPNLQKLGILYSGLESDSILILDEMKKAAKKTDLELKINMVNNLEELTNNMENLIHSVDAFFINEDSLVLSMINDLVRIADKESKPVFTSSIETIQHGATGAIGLDSTEIAHKAVEIMVQVMDNITIKDEYKKKHAIHKTNNIAPGSEDFEDLKKDHESNESYSQNNNTSHNNSNNQINQINQNIESITQTNTTDYNLINNSTIDNSTIEATTKTEKNKQNSNTDTDKITEVTQAETIEEATKTTEAKRNKDEDENLDTNSDTDSEIDTNLESKSENNLLNSSLEELEENVATMAYNQKVEKLTIKMNLERVENSNGQLTIVDIDSAMQEK